MDVMQALKWRYATKQFTDEVIDEGRVQQLLAAAGLSASSYGLQPYRLLIVKSTEVRQQLLEYSMGQNKVANCSHLIVFAAQTDIGSETVNRYVDKVSEVRGIPLAELQGMADHFKAALESMSEQKRQEWAHQQAYIALGNLLTCAALMAVDTCPMTGFEREGFDRILKLEKRALTTSVICPIGIRHPDDSTASMEKVRFDQDELVIAV